MSESPLSRGIRAFADTHVPLCDDIAGLKLNDGQSGISEMLLSRMAVSAVPAQWDLNLRTPRL